MINNYTDNQSSQINQDRVNVLSNRASNIMFIRFLAVLMFFTLYASTCYASPDSWQNTCINGNGACWRCQNCGIRNWQDSSRKNWRSEYFCSACGAKK